MQRPALLDLSAAGAERLRRACPGAYGAAARAVGCVDRAALGCRFAGTRQALRAEPEARLERILATEMTSCQRRGVFTDGLFRIGVQVPRGLATAGLPAPAYAELCENDASSLDSGCGVSAEGQSARWALPDAYVVLLALSEIPAATAAGGGSIRSLT